MKNRPLALLLLFACLAAAGCREDIDTFYGIQGEPYGKSSVNGTGVFANMFREAGHRVRSWRALSPSLEAADVIVWFPDDFKAPTAEIEQWLEDWFYGGDERTLIYVGRDYDAEPLYWDMVQGGASPEELAYLRVRRGRAASRFAGNRTATALIDAQRTDGWFTLEAMPQPHRAQSLSGPWSAGTPAVRTQIHTNGWLKPRSGADILLATEDGVMVGQLESESGDGEIYVVENGSFLLNLPLVEHEHRKLAARFVDAIGEESRSVVFLESDEEGPPILEEDPHATLPSTWQLLGVWPINFVLLHLAVLGVMFCAARIGVFGLPHELAGVSLSDYGRHAAALGELLHKTKDRAYAERVLAQYDLQVAKKKDASASSPTPLTPATPPASIPSASPPI